MARTMALLSLGVKAPIITEMRDRDNLAVIHGMLHNHQQQLDGGHEHGAPHPRVLPFAKPYASTSSQDDAARCVACVVQLRLSSDAQVLPFAGDDIVGSSMVQGAFQPGLTKVLHHILVR
jgi:hypothetical protein